MSQDLQRLGIKHTRTMVNTPKGNAVIERFFKSLKQECVWQHGFEILKKVSGLNIQRSKWVQYTRFYDVLKNEDLKMSDKKEMKNQELQFYRL